MNEKRFYSAVVQGIAVQAQDGATKTELRKLTEIALRVWRAGKKTGP